MFAQGNETVKFCEWSKYSVYDLPSCFNVKIYESKTIVILSVVVYGCETWSLTWRVRIRESRTKENM